MASVKRLVEGFRAKQTNVPYRKFLRVLNWIGVEIKNKPGAGRVVYYQGAYALTYHQPHRGKDPMNPWDVEKLLEFIDIQGLTLGEDNEEEGCPEDG